MRLRILLLALFALSMMARAAWSGAYSSGYEPYPKAKRFPMRTCSLEHSSEIGQEYVCRSKNDLSSIKIYAQNNSVELEVRRNDSLKVRIKLAGVNWLDYALEGDLNRDGLPDYVIVQASGGNGLASEYCQTIFVLSGKSGYVITKMSGMGFDPSDVLKLEVGQTNVVHTWFVSAEEPAADGKYHTFWVYHFFKIRGTKLMFDAARKPVWIQYKFKHNHTPTRLLSGDQKKRWWDKQREPIFIR